VHKTVSYNNPAWRK